MSKNGEFDTLVEAFRSDVDGMLETLWLCCTKNRLDSEDAKDVTSVMKTLTKKWEDAVKKCKPR